MADADRLTQACKTMLEEAQDYADRHADGSQAGAERSSRTGRHGNVGEPKATLPDLKAEFSSAPHNRGAVSMARAQNPDSANSQFFICNADANFLDGQYTLWGEVESGMEYVDALPVGEPPREPGRIIQAKVSKA